MRKNGRIHRKAKGLALNLGIIEKYKTSHFETIWDVMFYKRFTFVKKWCKTSKTRYDNNEDYIRPARLV